MPNDRNIMSPTVRDLAFDQLFWHGPSADDPLSGVKTVDDVNYQAALDHLSAVAAAAQGGPASGLEAPSEAAADYGPVYARLAMMDPARLTGQVKAFMDKFDEVFRHVTASDLQQHPCLQAARLVIDARKSANSGDPSQMQEYREIYDALAAKPALSNKDLMLLFFKAVIENQKNLQQMSAEQIAQNAYDAYQQQQHAANEEQAAGQRVLIGAGVNFAAQLGGAVVSVYGAKQALATSASAGAHMERAAGARAAAADPLRGDRVTAAQFADLSTAEAQTAMNDVQSINTRTTGYAAGVNAIGAMSQASGEKAAADSRSQAERDRALGALEQGHAQAAEAVYNDMCQAFKSVVNQAGEVLDTTTKAENMVAQNV